MAYQLLARVCGQERLPYRTTPSYRGFTSSISVPLPASSAGGLEEGSGEPRVFESSYQGASKKDAEKGVCVGLCLEVLFFFFFFFYLFLPLILFSQAERHGLVNPSPNGASAKIQNERLVDGSFLDFSPLSISLFIYFLPFPSPFSQNSLESPNVQMQAIPLTLQGDKRIVTH